MRTFNYSKLVRTLVLFFFFFCLKAGIAQSDGQLRRRLQASWSREAPGATAAPLDGPEQESRGLWQEQRCRFLGCAQVGEVEKAGTLTPGALMDRLTDKSGGLKTAPVKGQTVGSVGLGFPLHLCCHRVKAGR